MANCPKPVWVLFFRWTQNKTVLFYIITMNGDSIVQASKRTQKHHELFIKVVYISQELCIASLLKLNDSFILGLRTDQNVSLFTDNLPLPYTEPLEYWISALNSRTRSDWFINKRDQISELVWPQNTFWVKGAVYKMQKPLSLATPMEDGNTYAAIYC